MEIIKSKLQLVSGLHIGGSDDSMKIGGVDSPVIKRDIVCDENGEVSFSGKRKITEPYIPGSSLKGKIRSLLEHYFRLIDPHGDGKVVDSKSRFGNSKKRDLIVKLFGESAGVSDTKEIAIPRIVFRDSYITKEVRKAYLEDKVSLSEEKPENVIDRKTGTTLRGGLRFIERIPSGVEFDFEVVIRSFENDDIELLKNTALLGIKLLELDTLGGSGSRGYGKVKFLDINEDIETLAKKIEEKLK